MMATKICPVCKNEYEGGEVFCPLDGARVVTHTQMESGDIPDDPLIGQMLDKYKVIRQIGEGGMGLVYEGIHTVIEKRVAIKLLRDDFSSRPEVVARFRQEAKSASRIGHEHIVDISDFGETVTGASYFIMEYLEGEDLANVLEREGVLAVQRAIAIVSQCCRALGAAHSKGIVHRDMKPENIFLVSRHDNADFVKIVDFGIAKMSDIETPGEPGRKLTKTGMIFGTPEYMSPEQAAGKHLDHRVDVYAMGVILFECVTGRVPFVGDSFMGILTQHMFEDPPPLAEVNPHVECSAELEMVIYKALAKAPEDRYQDMPELLEALEAASEGRVAKSTLAGYGEPVKASRKPPRSLAPGRAVAPVAAPERSKLPMILAIVTVLALGGGTAAWFISQRPVVVAETPDVNTPPDAALVDAGGQPQVAVAPETGVAEDAGAEGPAMTIVRVETRPEGASVQVANTQQICGPTPCTLEVISGVPIVLQARHGLSVGDLEITPEGSSTTVQMALVRRTGAGRPPSTMSTTETGSDTRMTDGQTSTMMSGDLKVPDIFR
jgi:tRNA A-37 threonylcarbamoyl transferase component Bud32